MVTAPANRRTTSLVWANLGSAEYSWGLRCLFTGRRPLCCLVDAGFRPAQTPPSLSLGKAALPEVLPQLPWQLGQTIPASGRFDKLEGRVLPVFSSGLRSCTSTQLWDQISGPHCWGFRSACHYRTWPGTSFRAIERCVWKVTMRNETVGRQQRLPRSFLTCSRKAAKFKGQDISGNRVCLGNDAVKDPSILRTLNQSKWLSLSSLSLPTIITTTKHNNSIGLFLCHIH